jgi:PAS domain S-box-containing protein
VNFVKQKAHERRELGLQPRTEDSSRPEAILEGNRDINSRKGEQKFRNLLESAPDAIVIMTSRGEIHLVNAQTEKLFGYKREELLGLAVEVLIPQSRRAQHLPYRDEHLRSLQERPTGQVLELWARRKDGTLFPVEISLSLLETSEGTLITSVIRDVSEHRRAEDKIRHLNMELNQRLSDLSVVNKELESFSYSVSHDLRAPLRHIDGFARILKEEHAAVLSDDAHRYLDRVLQASNRMGQLVDDLLNLSKIGRKELARQKTKLGDLLRQVMTELPAEATSRNIEWRIDPLPDMDCDPGLIKLVLSNLLANAVKFTRLQQHPVIEVGTDEMNGTPTFYVRDNGVGFDPRYADKLFGAFQRLHREEQFEGTGVGLATVQRVIHRHGGKVWAESEPDCGATFFFTLGPQVASAVTNDTLEVKLGKV